MGKECPLLPLGSKGMLDCLIRQIYVTLVSETHFSWCSECSHMCQALLRHVRQLGIHAKSAAINASLLSGAVFKSVSSLINNHLLIVWMPQWWIPGGTLLPESLSPLSPGSMISLTPSAFLAPFTRPSISCTSCRIVSGLPRIAGSRAITRLPQFRLPSLSWTAPPTRGPARSSIMSAMLLPLYDLHQPHVCQHCQCHTVFPFQMGLNKAQMTC